MHNGLELPVYTHLQKAAAFEGGSQEFGSPFQETRRKVQKCFHAQPAPRWRVRRKGTERSSSCYGAVRTQQIQRGVPRGAQGGRDSFIGNTRLGFPPRLRVGLGHRGAKAGGAWGWETSGASSQPWLSGEEGADVAAVPGIPKTWRVPPMAWGPLLQGSSRSGCFASRREQSWTALAAGGPKPPPGVCRGIGAPSKQPPPAPGQMPVNRLFLPLPCSGARGPRAQPPRGKRLYLWLGTALETLFYPDMQPPNRTPPAQERH